MKAMKEPRLRVTRGAEGDRQSGPPQGTCGRRIVSGRSIRDAKSWAVGAWDDPLPIMMGFGRFLQQLRPNTDRSC